MDSLKVKNQSNGCSSFHRSNKAGSFVGASDRFNIVEGGSESGVKGKVDRGKEQAEV